MTLLGGAATALWVEQVGVIALPRKLVLAFGGRCSFCHAHGPDVFAFAGAVGRTERICAQCVSICLEILQEDTVSQPTAALASEAGFDRDRLEAAIDAALRRHGPDDAVAELLENLGLRDVGSSDAGLPSIALDQPPVLHCTFCAASQREVTKLIAGPSVYICDSCIGDAYAILASRGWRA